MTVLAFVSVLAFLGGGQKVDSLELLKENLPAAVREQFDEAHLEWAVERAEKRQGTVFVLLKGKGAVQQTAYFEVQPHGSRDEALAGLTKLVRMIAAPASGKLGDIGDECYFWTRQPERGGSVLRLRRGSLVVTVFAPTLAEAKAIAPAALDALGRAQERDDK